MKQFFLLSILNLCIFNIESASIKKRICDESHLSEDDTINMNFDSKLAEISLPNMIIDIKFFVIHDKNKGKLTATQIEKQIQALNDGFSGKHSDEVIDSNIRFRTKEIQYIQDSTLYKECGNQELKIASTYKGEPDKYLSIYTCDDSYLGFAYYPWSFSETS